MFSLFKQHFTFHTWCLAGFSCSCLVFAFFIVFFSHLHLSSYKTRVFYNIICKTHLMWSCSSVTMRSLRFYRHKHTHLLLNDIVQVDRKCRIFYLPKRWCRYSNIQSLFPIFQRKKSFTVELLICFSIRFSSDSIHFAPTNFQRDSLFWEKKRKPNRIFNLWIIYNLYR